MFADRELTFEELKEEKSLSLNEEEYIMQLSDNALTVEIALSSKAAVLKTADCQQLHQMMNAKVDKCAGIINGNRHLKFFDKNGKRNMADGARLKQELKLLDQQTDQLMKMAGNDKEEKIKAVCIQALRLFSIHPFNDGNKRIVKTMLRHFIEKEFKIMKRSKWKTIPRKVINQAVRGNNIGPFAREVCAIYNIPYAAHKITETEISPYKIYPKTGSKTYSMKKELSNSLLRKGSNVTFQEPIISRDELKELGIESGFIKKNKVCEDLLSSRKTDSFLRKIKKYHAGGQLTGQQAETLVRKLITISDGAEGINCDLATKKFLTTEVSDIKKAIKFYEKAEVENQNKEPLKKVSFNMDNELSRTEKESVEKTIRIR